jgi:phage terminase large subunit-like protein
MMRMEANLMTLIEESLWEKLAKLSEADQSTVIDGLSDNEKTALMYDWGVHQRPKQKTPEGNWRVWLILAGRGFGKTRTGAEFIREQVNKNTTEHIALVAPTAADCRDTMIEGESGILSVFPPAERPHYEPSKRRVTFKNGAMASAFSADEPDRLRGPNHDLAWADELAAWRYADAWDMLMFGLRIGKHPRVIVTTTPKPVSTLRSLLATKDGSVQVTSGSTYENKNNLAPSFLGEILARYEGTRLGRQELHAELLADVEGALWNRELLEETRVVKAPEMKRIVVAVDPAITNKADSDETGIVVAGICDRNEGYLLADRTMRGSPNDWGKAAVSAYHQFKADRIVAESNQGGDMVSHTLRTVDRNVPVKLVHASRGKRTRAEPIAAMYEQNRIHHVGFHAELEDQLCTWVPNEGHSPDRLDALVWGLTDLMIDGQRTAPPVVPFSLEQSSPWKVT